MGRNEEIQLISVVIPTYNRAYTLETAIYSVLTQRNCPPFEIIVVDDCSTDFTEELVKSIGSVVYIRHNSRRGAGDARNTGISASKGQLIAFLDSDDAWLSGKLAAQTDFFRMNPEAKVCTTSTVLLHDGEIVGECPYMGTTKHLLPTKFTFEQCLYTVLALPSALTLRKEVTNWTDVGVFNPFIIAEDYEYGIRLAAKYPIWFLPEIYTIKHQGGSDQRSKTDYRRPSVLMIEALTGIIERGSLSTHHQIVAERRLEHLVNRRDRNGLEKNKAL
jgi:glycosyltransferase involved in cell wall biosynthesis